MVVVLAVGSRDYRAGVNDDHVPLASLPVQASRTIVLARRSFRYLSGGAARVSPQCPGGLAVLRRLVTPRAGRLGNTNHSFQHLA
jgi:hypothetical protein